MSQPDPMQELFKPAVMAGLTNGCLYQILLWADKVLEFSILIAGGSGLRVPFLIWIKVQ